MTGRPELRIALIGAGAMGRDHARRLIREIPGAALVAVCDVDLESAREVAALAGDARAGADPEAVIRAEDVDAVVIASPGFTHEALVLTCFDAGKPVFCEKPLAPSSEAARRIVEAEAALGRRLLQVGFMRRYDAGFRRVEAAAQDGRLGRLRMLGCIHRAASVPGEPPAEFLVEDCLVHEFDQLRWLAGADPESVRIEGTTPAGEAAGGARDPILCLIRLRSGALGAVEVNVYSGTGYEVACSGVFDRGVIEAGRAHRLGGTAVLESGSVASPIAEDFTDRFAAAYREQFLDWTAAARRGTAAGPGAWDGYVAALAIDAGLESQRTGETAPVPRVERPAIYD